MPSLWDALSGKMHLPRSPGSSGMVINLLVNFFTGLTAGASVIVSQFFGSGDRKKVDDSIHTIYAFSIIGSVIMTLIGITAAPALLRLMNTPEELMSDSILYLRIYFAGIFFRVYLQYRSRAAPRTWRFQTSPVLSDDLLRHQYYSRPGS